MLTGGAWGCTKVIAGPCPRAGCQGSQGTSGSAHPSTLPAIVCRASIFPPAPPAVSRCTGSCFRPGASLLGTAFLLLVSIFIFEMTKSSLPVLSPCTPRPTPLKASVWSTQCAIVLSNQLLVKNPRLDRLSGQASRDVMQKRSQGLQNTSTEGLAG